MTYPRDRIRNFAIIAHVDHGKSTLADRMLQITELVDARLMREQYLDRMDLERERGITIKAQAVRMPYRDERGEYLLNLIDTPGHVDFSYEVSRAMNACEGAVLLVDAAQGMQAQTIANLYVAIEAGLEIIPVLNKIDLPAARPGEVAEEIVGLLGGDPADVLAVSAKTGEGVPAVLRRIVDLVPAPQGDADAPPRALLFDSIFDAYRGVIAYLRVVDGMLTPGQHMRLMATGYHHEIDELGVISPEPQPIDALGPGEVGFVTASIKEVAQAKVGDTLTDHAAPAPQPLPGYREPTPMVYCGLYPVDSGQFPELRDALEKLRLNDASFAFEPETSVALGFGFRAGFLGLLHMEIATERLDREFDIPLVTTAPNVAYEVTLEAQAGEEAEVVWVSNPAELPAANRIAAISEPIVDAMILVPSEYVGAVIQLCETRRGEMTKMEYLTPERVELHYRMPLAEIIFDFFDRLKSATRGYASLDYERAGLQTSQLGARRHPVERRVGRRVQRDRAPRQGLRVRQGDGEPAARADPTADVRRPDPGGDRLAGHRPRDGEGAAQGRAREVLRRRRLPQAQAARAPEGGQEADEGRRGGRDPPGGLRRGALRQRRLMAPAAVYVHVPFCAHRCGYCDFNVLVGGEALMGRYVRALRTQLRRVAVSRDDWPAFASVFVGGGTPTLLPAADLATVLAEVRDVLPLADDAEVTVEANPESVTGADLAQLVDAGLTRLSLGAQSFAAHVLAGLDRRHDPSSVAEAVDAARRAGVGQVSLDLIYGHPHESDGDWRATLGHALSLRPDHVSCYALTVERNTPYGVAVATGAAVAPDEEVQAARMHTADELLVAGGLRRYEVSNWARPGAESVHNRVYWRGGNWLAFGAGAHGHWEGHRWWNLRPPGRWVQRVERAESELGGEEVLSPEQRRQERLLTGLRTVEGLPTSASPSLHAARLAALEGEGLVTVDDGWLRPTPRGLAVADGMTLALLDR